MSAESELLAALRWGVDSQITNYDGDEVWLGPCFDQAGKRTGITDCCYADDPCDHHREVARRQQTLPPVGSYRTGGQRWDC